MSKERIIKWLGGYTEKELSDKILSNAYHKKLSYTFSEQKMMNRFYEEEYKNNPIAKDSVHRNLAAEIGIELLRNNLIYFDIEEDTGYSKLIKATLTLSTPYNN